MTREIKPYEPIAHERSCCMIGPRSESRTLAVDGLLSARFASWLGECAADCSMAAESPPLPAPLVLPADVQLRIINHLLPDTTNEKVLTAAQKTHNSLSLVSRATRELVNRVRYRTMIVSTAKSARLLLEHTDGLMHATIRRDLSSNVTIALREGQPSVKHLDTISLPLMSRFSVEQNSVDGFALQGACEVLAREARERGIRVVYE